MNERKEDVGARFRKVNGKWCVSVPKNCSWKPIANKSIYVRRKDRKHIRVCLTERIGRTEYDEIWRFKKSYHGLSPIKGP